MINERVNHLDVLGHMFTVVLFSFEAPVTRVTKIGVLWLLLKFLLWISDQVDKVRTEWSIFASGWGFCKKKKQNTFFP